MLDGTLIMWS